MAQFFKTEKERREFIKANREGNVGTYEPKEYVEPKIEEPAVEQEEPKKATKKTVKKKAEK